MSKPAPIIFLLGTSTAGKSTVCEEILRQDQASENLGFKIWGTDLESENDMTRCRDLLKDDDRFLAIEPQFPNVWKIVAGIYLGEVWDAESKEMLTLKDDKKFAESVDSFLEKTKGRYNKEALEVLKTLAKENPNNFKEKAGLTNEELNARIFDHAIQNSKNGNPTILDMVPDFGGRDLIEDFKEHLAKRDFACPTHTVLVHLPVKDLAERMDQRNKRALAEGGNSGDQRDGIFPFKQYATTFGVSAGDGSQDLGTLRQADIYQAVEKFGDENGVKIRDMKVVAADDPEAEHKSKMRGVFATVREGKKLLDQVGFEDGETSIILGAKVKADAIYDHSSIGSTAQIAEAIYDWTKEKMSERQAQGEEEKTSKFSEKYPSRKDGNKPFVAAVLGEDDGKSGGSR